MQRPPVPSLKKRFGQHHLVRSELCRPLIDFLHPAGRNVVEIGPGGGVLTAPLVERGAKVTAIEMDAEWAWTLRRSLADETLRIVIGDAMAVAWERLRPGTMVAGNLPYQISTALIERLLPLHDLIPRAGFLVQREVAERLVARPGEPAFGSLSVLADAYAQTEMLARVTRSSFRPPPKVEGAFIGMRLRKPPLATAQMPGFVSLVRLSFSLRRKTLRNALASRWGRERAAAAVAALGMGDLVRAEEMDLEAFLRLYEIQRAS